MTDQLEPVYQVKLLAALRSGDPALIHPFLAEIGKDRRSSTDLSAAAIDTAAAALHLAVRCASAQTLSLLLSHRAISPNGVHPPGSGTTALHLAAALGRPEIVNLLLEQEGIDDNLRDAQGRTCRDVAKGREVVKAINDSRSFLNASYRSLLRSYILSPVSEPPSSALIQLLESPRAAFVDLSYLDDDTGSSLLHEAARRKDLRLIELAVRAGADVFVRNRRGKTPYESVGKDDKVRVFLRQFANHDRTLIQPSTPSYEPPILKGYLNKYTNVAKGYSTRWFVLAHGVLSYYRHQDDESVASRGSISMRNAVIRVSERTKFEIQSVPPPSKSSTTVLGTSSSSTVQKWYIRANHPVESSRWVQAITKSIEWYKRCPASSAETDMARRPSAESDRSDRRSMLSGTGYSNTIGKRPTRSRQSTAYGDRGGDKDSDSSINAALSGEPTQMSDASWRRDGDDGDEDQDDTSSADTGNRQVPPHEAAFELHVNSTMAQLEVTQQLLAGFLGPGSIVGIVAPSPVLPAVATAAAAAALSSARSITSVTSSSTPSTSSSKSTKSLTSTPLISNKNPSIAETKSALLSSLSTLHALVNEYHTMASTREQWFKKQLAKERARQAVWEESLATVVKEGAVLEQELKIRSRRRGSRVFGLGEVLGAMPNPGTGGGGVGSIGRRSRYSTIRPSIVVEEEEARVEKGKEREKVEGEKSVVLDRGVVDSPVPDESKGKEERVKPERDETIKISTSGLARIAEAAAAATENEEGFDSGDSEDEFFDAIDANNIPNLVVPDQLSHPLTSSGHLPPYVSVEPYVGYSVLRTKLETADERPPTSLWSVLKHSIGKDLTRISFPVFFNEPTSMLQRMAEDMEFSECLDTAATQKDSLKRLAFVAAFAMSNYSSTIGRIAKPFNPMLSETFEYVRMDKKYRYVSEQVSHHPPISACWAESPLWHYYGEVDAQNKFMGKSFEIRPTGVAHAELVIPESWISNKKYPKANGAMGEGKVVEHYTWKKVTTNVSGFILGSPTIDHYGDMIITNHRTQEQCILTFKPRGWRGKDAYEISGQVMDARGRPVYDIAGRWNSQLIMRKAGMGHDGALHPDTSIGSPVGTLANGANGLTSPTHGEYILLWKNSTKPSGSPFNLTPFAISLNHCPPETLRPFLAPTDCRLRPDQRAFEWAKYDLANELKQRQEEKQRMTRKERESGVREKHRARWFVAETDGDTGERVWVPKRVRVKMALHEKSEGGANENGTVDGEERVVEEDRVEYWVERERVWREGGRGKVEGVEWEDVEDIFIEEPEVIRNL
ncbi:hypothetical protein P691DRAFT_846150 [Macrolepiota fuliginosa MF-IS2]|uniref:PH domain-containing protein n=1 Tax=Macrolepiota fuliginosa MF-IS2 TaxID=1400762 RepID=A0A9P6BYP5_9AGAR|nr:hypothetical protein P691DRAFT_846150 [Macrolepiota fuliginosa MF-IS2]